MTKTIKTISAFALIATLSLIAFASVDFNAATGTGFVGKGVVQTPFGWNNAAAQRNATLVTFTYEVIETYDVTIEFDTGNPNQPKSIKHHVVTQNKSSAVNANIASDPRRTGQYTGWNLLGFGSTVVSGDAIPDVGNSCPNGNLGTCVVTDVQMSSSTGGLYAHFGGNSVLIY